MVKITSTLDEKGFLCPRCGDLVFKDRHALSRRDNKTEICSNCGTEEAMFDLKTSQISLWKSDKEKKILVEKEKEWLKWMKK